MRDTLRQVATFLLVGFLGVCVNIATYAALIVAGWHYLTASAAAWFAALLAGFLLNRVFTFRSTAAVSRSLFRTTLVYVGQLALVSAGIALLVEVAGFGELLAFATMMVPGLAFSFLGLRYYAFAR